MTDLLWVLLLLAMGFCGYRIMDRADRFLDRHVKGEEEKKDEQQQR